MTGSANPRLWAAILGAGVAAALVLVLQTRLTRNGLFDNAAAFSPGGKKIVFSSNRITNSTEFFVMNSDGTGVKELTDDLGASFDPSFSPDGQRIAYVSNRDGDFEVFRMSSEDTDADGQGDNPRNLSKTAGQDLDPTYSPSGARIAFQSNRDGNAEIYVLDATTGERQTNLTNNGAVDIQSAWQPLP